MVRKQPCNPFSEKTTDNGKLRQLINLLSGHISDLKKVVWTKHFFSACEVRNLYMLLLRKEFSPEQEKT